MSPCSGGCHPVTCPGSSARKMESQSRSAYTTVKRQTQSPRWAGHWVPEESRDTRETKVRPPGGRVARAEGDQSVGHSARPHLL